MSIDPKVLQNIHTAKAEQRKKLARLGFHEKIMILVSLQKRADGIIRSRGGAGRRIWKLPSES
jgi:hypothetical protein